MFRIPRRKRLLARRYRPVNPGGFVFVFLFSLLNIFGCSNQPRISFPSFERDYFLGKLEVENTFGHFTNASAISIDGFGDIYISDADAPGIYKFSKAGDSLRAVIAYGRDHGQFDSPLELDASLTNAVAIADRNNNRIELYSRELIWQATIDGHSGGSEIKFGQPTCVRAAGSGYYYIIDGENNRLIAINPSRGLQQLVNTSGSSLGLDLKPQSIAIDPNEYINVADANFRALLLFNNTLTPIKQIRYSPANEARLGTYGEHLVVFDPRSSTIRLFDFHDFSYHGSYSLPSQARGAVMAVIKDDRVYLLTKQQVIVCSIHPTD